MGGIRNDAALCFIRPVYDCAFAHALDSPSMSTTSLLVQSLPVLAQGAVLTVKFAVLSMVFGLLGAVVLAMMGIRQS